MNTSQNFYNHNKSKDGLFPYCKKCHKLKSSKWQKDNPEEYNDIREKHFLTEKFKVWNKNNSRKNRETGIQLNWQRDNPIKVKGYGLKYLSKKHKINIAEWEACKKYFIHRCAYCGLAIEDHWIQYDGVIKLGDFHKEHVDDNGANNLSNCVPSCKECNSSKHKFLFDNWYLQQEFYTQERYDKITKWTIEDHKLYIKITQ